MFSLRTKVKIVSSKKTDGKFNYGTIVGVDQSYPYLGFTTERDYLSGFEVYRYKVAYVDCFTGKGCADWFRPSELEKKTKEN